MPTKIGNELCFLDQLVCARGPTHSPCKNQKKSGRLRPFPKKIQGFVPKPTSGPGPPPPGILTEKKPGIGQLMLTNEEMVMLHDKTNFQSSCEL